MAIENGNILNPSTFSLPSTGGTVSAFVGNGSVDSIPAVLRVTNDVNITGTQTVYLTDDGTQTGVPLFNSVFQVFGFPVLNNIHPNRAIVPMITIISNVEIYVEIYHGNSIYNMPLDINFLVFGESAI